LELRRDCNNETPQIEKQLEDTLRWTGTLSECAREGLPKRAQEKKRDVLMCLSAWLPRI